MRFTTMAKCCSTGHPIIYFIHLLRYLSYTVVSNSHQYGDHLEYYSKPKTYWIVCFVLMTLSFFLLSALHVYLTKFCPKAIIAFADCLKPIYSKDVALSFGIQDSQVAEHNRRFKVALQMSTAMIYFSA